jgi:threonine/homoserine/homoserine lactone efflux protein
MTPTTAVTTTTTTIIIIIIITTTTTTTTMVMAWLSVPAVSKEWLDGKKREDEQLERRMAGVDP